MQTDTDYESSTQDAGGRKIIQILKVTEGLVEQELRKMGREVHRARPGQAAAGERGDERKMGLTDQEYNQLVAQLTQAFFSGPDEDDHELQRLIDEANNTPIDKYNESLIRRLDERIYDSWKEFWSELAAACAPVILMFVGVYAIYRLGLDQMIRNILLFCALSAAVGLSVLLFFIASRSYLKGAEMWQRLFRPSWRGALAAGCLIAALLGCISSYYFQRRSENRQLIVNYSRELATQQLIDVAIRKFQRQLLSRNEPIDRPSAAPPGDGASVDFGLSEAASAAAAWMSEANPVIEITEQKVSSGETVISASMIGLQDNVEMKLKPGYGVIDQSPFSREVAVGELKASADGFVLLGLNGGLMPQPLRLDGGAFDIPAGQIQNKYIAVVFKPGDPQNQGGIIRKTERVQILASHK